MTHGQRVTFQIGRRTLLATGAVGAGAVTVASTSGTADATSGEGAFLHGVASGDPFPTSVLLWTRVTPVPEARPGSGAGPTVTVTWEVARDAAFTTIVSQGQTRTGAYRDHTVKVVAEGLAPQTSYWYRFAYAGRISRVGRTRTAPAADEVPDNLRFGIVSCSNLQAGYFSAYRGLAERNDLHAIVFLGDYIYEYGPGDYGYGNANVDIRSHKPPREMVSLADYRQRHAQYKRDPDLQRLHARYPWVVTWDDHEVTNDQWSGGAENHDPSEGDYLVRRAGAHRAYDEWMPVRMNGTAKLGDGDRLYRRIRFGQLAELSMLDLRTYRSQQASGPTDPAIDDPARTITGDAQLAFLKQSLTNGRAQWKVIGNPVMIAPVTFANLPADVLQSIGDVTGMRPPATVGSDGVPYNVDQWDGYTADRHRVFDHIRDTGVTDALFITGDIHSGWGCELPYDTSTYPLGASAGVEFVCSSVTSNNLDDILGVPPRTASLAVEETIMANNRHVKYLDFDNHGFSVLDITSQRAQMDWYILGDRADPNTSITLTRSLVTLAGTALVSEATGPIA